MRILLVDNDNDLLETLLAALSELPGHDIRGAINAGSALQALAAMGGIDILITDVVMEPMNGFALRDQIQRRCPEARVIFMSGFDLSDYAAQLEGHLTLQKPFDFPTLLDVVERELAGIDSHSQETEDQQPDEKFLETQSLELPERTAQQAPTVTPVAQPVSPRQPVPTVRAVPVAQPRVSAVPQPKAVAQPTAKPQAQAAIPRATPRPSPVPQSAPAATAQPQSPVIDSYTGTTFGSYQITNLLGSSRWGLVFAAVQISINRPVTLRILDATLAADPQQKERFIADARAKAHIQHPAILSVYEAGEHGGQNFYAHEYVPGLTLEDYQRNAQKVDEPTALRIFRVVGEGLAYLHGHHLAHSPVDASSIYLADDGQPRLGNVATQIADQPLTAEEEIKALGRIMLSVLPAAQQLSPGLRTMIGRMVQTGPDAITAFGTLLQGVKALEPKVVPMEAAKISAQDHAAIQAVEAARRAQKRSLYSTALSMMLTLALVVGIVWYKFFRSNERSTVAQIEIPAGTYIVGKEKVPLETFWIDKYEVTIGQYSKFLAYLDAHPTADAELNHPKQPRMLNHRPADWNIYYGNARQGTPVHNTPMSLNSPMLMVTWWDAYAYARWKGRELPTEEEWEAAARGPNGLVYPWGNEFDAARVNSNADYKQNEPAIKGAVDGFNYWGDVDMMKGDKSHFGVIGMAGNVSEWVAWSKEGGTLPIYKGGNFKSADVRLDKRVTDHSPAKGEEHIGFRTISRTPPVKK